MNYIYQISLNWFLLYYFSLGLILLYQGYQWYFKPEPFLSYLTEHAKKGEQPRLVLKTLRYLFSFTLLSLILSFFPFSIIELIFSLWSFLMIFILGSFFLNWESLRKVITENPASTHAQIKKGGVMMVSLGVVMFLLAWVLLTSA